MKLAIFLTFAFSVHALAEVKAQKITLHAEDVTLQHVMKEIQKQQGYSFLFRGDEIADMRVVVKLKDVDFADAMHAILDERSLAWSLDDGIITIVRKPLRPTSYKSEYTQERMLTGEVTDENGNPLEGVTVSVEGTKAITATDALGRFKISTPDEEAVLSFTLVGFERLELSVYNESPLSVSLKELISDLDEVVVVGMNIRQSKRSVTGSIATIQTKELRQSPVANLNNALAGRLPGLISVQSSGQPGADAAALFIRGIGTYGPNTSPLIVVDGLPRSQGNFSQIDPNEVESISILKDATSSALYGIQGANGVIVVTTKRGGANERPSINFTAQTAMQQPIRLPQNMSAYELALYFNDWDANSGLIPRFSEDALAIVKTGSDPYLYPNVNWFDEILKTSSPQQQYNLNISGKTNRVKYFVSGSYINQGTLLKYDNLFVDNYGQKSKFDRYNFRSNIDLEATSMLTIQVDLAGRLEQRVGPGPGFERVFSDISTMLPFALPLFNPDGTLGAASAVEIPFWKNPYGVVTQSGYYTDYTNVMYGTLSAKHKLDFITKGLSAQLFFSFENDNFKGTTRSQEFASYWYRGSDANGKPLYQQEQEASRLSTSGRSSIERSNYLDGRIVYNRQFGEHDVSGQVLFNRTLRVLNDELPYAYQGVSSRFTYGFRSKYFAEVNLGYNGSENFPEDRRYGFFPSVSAGWIVSDESFMNDVSFLNFLKLRGSYGFSGNDKIGNARWLFISDFASASGYEFGVSISGRPGFNENRVGNSFVTWEKSEKSNIGFELSLFKQDLLQLTFDVFEEKRTDILTTPGTVPDYVGINGLAPRNSGVVLNRGIDAELRLHKQLSDFRVFANFQFTYTKNRVLENDQPTPAFPYQDLRGHEVGYQLGYKAIGFFRDAKDIAESPVQNFDAKTIPGDVKYQDTNGDGIIDAFDRLPIQIQNVPRYVAGISFGAGYKGFDVSVLLNGAYGGTATMGATQKDIIQLERWTPDNQENARVPVPKSSSNNFVTSSFWIQRTDYLKLRNIEIGYGLPAHWIQPVKISSMRVFLNGQNLALWDKLWIKDRDPESSGPWTIPYPLQRVVNIGVNVNF